MSARHIGYAVRAAQTLGLLDADKALTALGARKVACVHPFDEDYDASMARSVRSLTCPNACMSSASRLVRLEPGWRNARRSA
mgnify:CR=1 FL=1